MGSKRLPAPWGDRLDRSRPISFSFNGHAVAAWLGDTVASALLAAGFGLVGRSYKLHRPRGIYTCGPEEPTGIAEVGTEDRLTPNTRLTEIQATEGLRVCSGNCWPGLRCDLLAGLGAFSAMLPAGFYYKTFMWPGWKCFEPLIRRLAAAGAVSLRPDPDAYEEMSVAVDVLVVGAGVAGLRAAVAAAQAGRDVLVLEADAAPGGYLAAQRPVQSESATDAAGLCAALQHAGGRLLLRTTALGAYDHHFVTAVQDLSQPGQVRERLWKIRAGEIVLATGAFDRPMLFPDNDRPGIMLAGALARYASHYGVACGERIVLATSCDAAYDVARTLCEAGIAVAAIIDRRPAALIRAEPCHARIDWHTHSTVIGVRGGAGGVRGVVVGDLDRRTRLRIECDAVGSTSGATPNVNLYSQLGGGLRWIEHCSMFVPDTRIPNVAVVGACAGMFDVAAALAHADAVGRSGAGAARLGGFGPGGFGAVPPNTLPRAFAAIRPGRSFVDLQNDVTARDIDIAARENYRSVEHLKRYTTIGMATDQGKTSNVNAIMLMGEATGRPVDQVGTTRFRPPYRPVTLSAIAAGRSGARLRPLRRLHARAFHEARGAMFEEFSGWERPAAYPSVGETLSEAAQREADHVRHHVGLFDGSPLGKIEVYGPDAAAFLDLMFVGQISSIAIGGARYAVRLNEHGVVVDDGIVARLGPSQFWVNTTSGSADQAVLVFEEWLQCEYPALRVLICPVTTQWGNVTVSGPKAWPLLASLGADEAFSPLRMKHMTMREGAIDGESVRVLRASFSGEVGYEINLAASRTERLLQRLWHAGQPHSVAMYGVEALMTLRIEKGYMHVGVDTDGTTLPQDVGLWTGSSRKTANFVGRRSLRRPAGMDPDRPRLVGLQPMDRKTSIPVGASLSSASTPHVAEGHVTSSCFSPAISAPIALAQLARGAGRLGERLWCDAMGTRIEVEVVSTPFFDPKGARLDG